MDRVQVRDPILAHQLRARDPRPILLHRHHMACHRRSHRGDRDAGPPAEATTGVTTATMTLEEAEADRRVVLEPTDPEDDEEMMTMKIGIGTISNTSSRS